MIPKIIHQIWLWSELPLKYREYQESWKNYHSGWQFCMWNESNITSLENFDEHLFNTCCCFSEKSDYLRVLILLEKWGVYVDTDIECLKPIDELCKDAVFFIWREDTHYSTALFGSISQHRFLKKIHASFQKRLSIHSGKYSLDLISVKFVSKIINSFNLITQEKIFPEHFFYPVHYLEYFDWMNIPLTSVVHSYSIHHYWWSWAPRRHLFIRKMMKYKFFRYFFIWFYLPFKNNLSSYIWVRKN